MLLLAWTVSPITLVLTEDKTDLKVNETITFHLVVRDAGRMGGQLVILRENGSNNFIAAGLPRFASSCTLCKGGSDLGDINDDSPYIPLREGRYKAVATYGGSSQEVNFTVRPFTTSSTSTTSSTTSTTSTTMRPATTIRATSTTTSSTTTTSLTTSTTTTTSTTSTAPEENGRKTMLTLYLFGVLLVLSILVFAYPRKKRDEVS